MKRRGPVDPEKRWLKFLKYEDNGCITHTGASNGNGYAQFNYKARPGHSGYAHVYAWERVNGPVQSGMTVDHICENKRCVNIEHLQVVSGAENSRLYQTRRTTCSNGIHQKHGLGQCKECQRETWIRCEEKRKAKRTRKQDYIARIRKTDPEELAASVNAIIMGQSRLAEEARRLGITSGPLERHCWKEAKRRVVARSGGRCEICGIMIEKNGGDAHHRRPRQKGGSSLALINYGLANLLHLHRSCHELVESNRQRALENGWLVSQWRAPATVPVKRWDGLFLLADDGSVSPA